MYKQDAISFFGTGVKVASAAGVSSAAVSAWGEIIPQGRAERLARASNGALIYDIDFYDKYKPNANVPRKQQTNTPDA
jgi:predicted amidohydrolase